jgi:peroxiredoxin
LAEYRDRYDEIRAVGADLVAISIDPPERSQELRSDLGLPFTVLSDVSRIVIRDFGVLNPRERGGVALPSVFIIDRERGVVFSAKDHKMKRVPATGVLLRLRDPRAFATASSLRACVPRPRDFFLAIRNKFPRG